MWWYTQALHASNVRSFSGVKGIPLMTVKEVAPMLTLQASPETPISPSAQRLLLLEVTSETPNEGWKICMRTKREAASEMLPWTLLLSASTQAASTKEANPPLGRCRYGSQAVVCRISLLMTKQVAPLWPRRAVPTDHLPFRWLTTNYTTQEKQNSAERTLRC